MRKHLIFALTVVVMAMLAFASCDKKKTTNNTDLPTTSDGAQKRLTREEQVDKLNDLGQKVLANFKTQEQEDLIRLTDYLAARFENANWKAVLDSAGEGHAAYPGLNPMMATMRRLSVNACYAPMDFMAVVTPDNWYVSDFYGEFEYIDSDSKWRFIAKNDNAAIFHCTDMTGKEVLITIKATGDTYSITDTVKVYDYNTTKRIYVVDYWDENTEKYVEGREISEKLFKELLNNRDEGDDEYFTATYNGIYYHVHVGYPYTMQPYTVHVPTNIEATLNDNGTEMININLSFDINRKDHVKVAGNVRLANVIQTYDLNITRNAVRGNYEMAVNGKSICKLALDNNGFNALAIDPNNNLSTRGDVNKYETKLQNELKPGKTTILLTLLGGEMSIRGEIDGDALYNGLKKMKEKEYNEQRQWATDYAENWNENVYMFVYYGSDIKQAQIKMDVDDMNYEVVPVIYFIEDKMAMQFDEFFTRRSYGDLIDATEALINGYISFFKEHQIEPVDF